MKILIFTVTIGAGHNQVANNIACKLKEDNHDVLVCDMFIDKKFCSWMISKFGFKCMMKMPKISNYFYDQSKKENKVFFETFVRKIKDKTLKIINDFKPDIVISSHIAGYHFIKKYEKEIEKPVKSYFIVTDYDLTPGLKNFKDNEYIVIPNEDFKDDLIKLGIKEDHILSFGIPIDKKFYNTISVETAKEKLNINLDENKPIILITGGGVGLGKNYKVIKELSKHDDLQIISVAGKNEKLKKKVDKLATKSKAKIISYGFTKEIDYLMTISDLIIGKAGGLTTTEALAKGVPFFSLSNTPKPEYANLLYFMKNDIAKEIKRPKDLYEIIINSDFEEMKNKIKENFVINDTCTMLLKHIVQNSSKDN